MSLSPFCLILDFELINITSKRFNFILLLDFFRLVFILTVILISTSVFIFSFSYIKYDKFFNRFHMLLFSFIFSMLMLILRPNIIRILLGWDGLGISSYLLVIYYSRNKSYNSGMITFARNRVGDALIIISLRYLLYSITLDISVLSYFFEIDYYWVIIIVLVASCTKRAQIPFRAWLPAAIAAPTPVSSLVHSSTLVTAGVYLLFRFDFILVYFRINKILLLLGVLTILIARIRAFFEKDIKKIVALSTLRQLGVIICALGAGFRILGFFHLLSHAFFKALLFVRAGRLIHNSNRYQDLRKMGGSADVLPFTKRIIIGCLLSLCGLPFMSAFYSKEMIIERLLIFNLSFMSYFIMVAGIFITVFYSLRFLRVSIRWWPRQFVLCFKSDSDSLVNLRIILLFLPAISGGSLIRSQIKFNFFLLISFKIKIFVLILLISSLLIFWNSYFYLSNLLKLWQWNMRNLWGLPFVRARLPLFVFLNKGDILFKIIDFSWVYYIFYNLYSEKIFNKFLFFNNFFIRVTRLTVLVMMLMFIILN